MRQHSEPTDDQTRKSQVSARITVGRNQNQGPGNAKHIQLGDKLIPDRGSAELAEPRGLQETVSDAQSRLQDSGLSSSETMPAAVPVRRSSERVDVQRGPEENPEGGVLSRPIHFDNGNVRIDAENTPYTTGPNISVSERLHEECESIMQKLTAEIALSGDFPSKDRLCLKVSLGEQLTSDGQKRCFTICEPPRLPPEDQQSPE